MTDGEAGLPTASDFSMVKAGWIDIDQHDFRAKGVTWWRETVDRIAPGNTCCALPCCSSLIECYTHAHFTASSPNDSTREATRAEMPGIVLDGWDQQGGQLLVPDTPQREGSS